MAIARSPVPERYEEERLPFGPEFQKALIVLLCDDPGFAAGLSQFLRPKHFDSMPLAWAYSTIENYRATYGTTPTVLALMELTRSLPPQEAQLCAAVLDGMRALQIRDEAWLRDQAMEFARRGVFARAFQESRDLFNTGQYTKAYDLMMKRMDELRLIQATPPDRGHFFEELGHRQAKRMGSDPTLDSIGTSIGWLDKILDGGLSLGELGLWIAYPKGGKSTILTTLGVASTRICSRNTLHCVFEGSRQQVETRYDTAFSRELYGQVKRGNVSASGYSFLVKEYQYLKGKLVIRGFTDSWDYNVLHIHEELRDLKQRDGFVPEMIVVDYGDLLGGREKSYHSETAKQQAAYRDLKTLANRGYAVWTASQAQRPSDGAEDEPHLLKSRNIADAYAKVRIADFIGSLNQTRKEKAEKVIRLYAELYRDNEADRTFVARCDFSIMRIWEEAGLSSPSVPSTPSTPALGYVVPTPTKAPL